jgi:hypothetical protein
MYYSFNKLMPGYVSWNFTAYTLKEIISSASELFVRKKW